MSKAATHVLLISVLATVALFSPAAAQAPADTSADARLRALYTEEWSWRQKELGRGGAADDRFAPVDAASQQARLAYWTRTLATLDTIPFDQLSAEEKINAQIFRTSLRALVSDVQYRTYEAPFNSDTFFWTSFTPRQGLATAAAYRAYLARLRDVPRYFDEQITNMRTGLARGYSVPRVSVIGRDQTIEPYVKADASNPLYAPFAQMPAGIPAADQAALRAEADTVIRELVAPAYAKLLTMIRQEYLEKARRTLGAFELPDGTKFYQAQIEKHTTLTLTPKEIHDIGLKEVARLEAEMRATKDKAGFKGTMAEFFRFMRTAPQFYAKTPRELLSYSAYVSKKADDKLADTIGFLPRRRHGIRPVPDAIAPIYTGGRGGLEACLMNTYNLPARPLYTLAALTLHECTPGHSFQAALALEGPERPAFRRGTSFSGYGEGWGLYVEWLGTLMGIYETPYEDMGRLTYEMWRACRLVIDTGIHQFGWTREQAMSYLRDRAPLSEHEITTEIDRYIAWPGQALAYKLGELQIRRHRREAEEKLGDKFDQRRFHDAILAIGSVPLLVLEQRMTQFIADESALTTSLVAAEPDWARFRGPNGSGLSTATGVPTQFGPEKNLLWRLALPQGHSSPILYQDRLYLTALRGNDLVTMAIDRLAGKILWERIAPQVTTKVVDKRNNPASPSPAVEADGVYVFFPDYGLVAYNAAGKQLWQLPLGPFNNIYGMGASPVIAGDLLILACDQSLGSYVMALDKRTGKPVWKVDRPEAKSGHSTPILWRGPDGRDQVLLPGSFLLTSYDAATGKKLWWVGGLSFEMKSTPVIGGDTIYVNGYGAPVNDPGNKISIPAADQVWKTADANGDGFIQKTEFPKFTQAFWFDVADLDVNGSLNQDEWAYYRAALDSENGMLAIRLGGSGDMSDTAMRWKYQRSVPQLPSPLLYRNVLYMVNDNGIVTTLNPDTGAVIKQGRLTGAPGAVFASPIAADGHVYFTTEAGAVVVVSPGGDLTVESVNALNEEAYATPAVADGRIYVRTTQALYAFGAN